MEDSLIVGLDIGTSKVVCVISEKDEKNELKVVGVGVSNSEGLRKGVVVNIDKTVESIKKAVEEAELMAGRDVDSVWVGIGGEHIKAINGKGVVAIPKDDRGITEHDVTRAIDAAKAVSIPLDMEIIHIIPQEFTVDNDKGIKEPVGMCGVRLETQVHIITGAVTNAQNIYKSVDKAGLKVIDMVLNPLASSYSVLEKDEKELGVAMVDLGGGTTDIAIYFENSIRHTAVIGLGGKNITSDIALGIRTPIERAEEIKKKYGCACASIVSKDEYISVPGVGGREQREVSKAVLASIIEPRIEEIFTLALREIRRTEYSDLLGAGIVLTGGCALMEGIKELGERVFEQPVRIGVPQRVGGLTETISSPIYSTSVGLCLYALENEQKQKEKKKQSGKDFWNNIWVKTKDIIRDFF